MVTFGKYDIATKIGKNIEELVRNLHKFKINRKNRHKRAPVPVCGYDLALGRIRVVTVGVLLPDLAIGSVNNDFRAIIDCNIPCNSYSFLLRRNNSRSSAVSSALYLPVVSVRGNMLIFRHKL